MAGGAHPIRPAMVHREPGVIEGCAQPSGRRVTGCARGRKSGRHVIRTVGRLIVGLVTAEAIRRHGGVVIVDVAARARHRGMRPGQRETGVVVIETRWTPRGGVVAHVTLLRESGRNVIRVICALKILQVTADTTGCAYVVVAVDMALATLHSCMRAGERPTGSRMIEVRGVPVCGGVTDLALLRETGRHMVRIGGAPEVV